MRVLAIDPGLRNLAFCVLDKQGDVEVLERVDIFAGRPIELSGVCDAMVRWVGEHRALLDSADTIVIERQFANRLAVLSACLLIVQTTVQAMYHAKVVLVPAISVKKRFKTAAGSYTENKKAAVAKARELAGSGKDRARFEAAPGKKLDDIADSFLLAKFWLGAG